MMGWRRAVMTALATCGIVLGVWRLSTRTTQAGDPAGGTIGAELSQDDVTVRAYQRLGFEGIVYGVTARVPGTLVVRVQDRPKRSHLLGTEALTGSDRWSTSLRMKLVPTDTRERVMWLWRKWPVQAMRNLQPSASKGMIEALLLESRSADEKPVVTVDVLDESGLVPIGRWSGSDDQSSGVWGALPESVTPASGLRSTRSTITRASLRVTKLAWSAVACWLWSPEDLQVTSVTMPSPGVVKVISASREWAVEDFPYPCLVMMLRIEE